MWSRLFPVIAAMLIAVAAAAAPVEAPWVGIGPDRKPEVRLYFFWALTCPHCTEAHPYIEAIPGARPWVRLHALELTRHPENVWRYQAMAEGLGEAAASVPAFLFCGEMVVGWEGDEATGAYIRRRLDECRARAMSTLAPRPAVGKPARQADGTPIPAPNPGVVGDPAIHQPDSPPRPTPNPIEPGAEDARQIPPADSPDTSGPRDPSTPATRPSAPIRLPILGAVDPASLSLPVLTLVLAGLDAFNPCAFFVLLFLLSMMAHQRSQARMLAIGGVFVTVSGVMYFAFMAAWLSVFQLFGHLAWVTLAAGALAVFVGAVNVKDFFLFERGLTLSIPESKKPDIFRRTRAILNAEKLPAMLAATLFLAIAANFYELLCTAGFPMVYTRLLTLADLAPAARYGYLAAYNLIYVLPLVVIVVVFARSLGSRKLTEREGRLLKLMSGLMMLELGALLLWAPELISRVGIAFGLMALAVGITWVAARLTRRRT